LIVVSSDDFWYDSGDGGVRGERLSQRLVFSSLCGAAAVQFCDRLFGCVDIVAFDAQGALKCDAQLSVFVDIEETKDEMVSEQPELAGQGAHHVLPLALHVALERRIYPGRQWQ